MVKIRMEKIAVVIYHVYISIPCKHDEIDLDIPVVLLKKDDQYLLFGRCSLATITLKKKTFKPLWRLFMDGV